ncbi:MAG: InlB B-repeat-containing protein [Lachnospiraceae bacterium]
MYSHKQLDGHTKKQMRNTKKQRKNKLYLMIGGILLGFILAAGVSDGAVEAAETQNNLRNGSFEEGQSWKVGSTKAYNTQSQDDIPYWNTTAKDKKIEVFIENPATNVPGTYVKVGNGYATLKPTNGDYAVELNANEESTLYQNVSTTPYSIYKWGLDHGARVGTDTMALVIGPKQDVEPAKPEVNGRDQFMQMIDWLITQNKTSVKDGEHTGLGEQLTVYSKKFAAGGTFADNAGNNAFSMTPSSIYTEEWHIWIMADSAATTVGVDNPWGKYGSNAPDAASQTYYQYTVPSGQRETLFGFVSVGSDGNTNKTFGNFLDNINFQLLHPLSGSTTLHGSGVVSDSTGSISGGGGAGSGYEVTVDHSLITYAVEGEALELKAVVKSADANDGCEFVGLYHTVQDENGNLVTTFLQRAGNEIEDTGSLTEEQKAGKWIKSTNSDNDIIYTYYLDDLTSATDLHFVFIKSPTVTYDSNGGKAYEVEREYNTSEAANVYSFKPFTTGEGEGVTYTFIKPYQSKAAEGPEGAEAGSWKFMGWLLTGDTVTSSTIPESDLVNKDELNLLLLPEVHTIACDYVAEGSTTKEQYFKIWSGSKELTDTNAGEGVRTSAKWQPTSGGVLDDLVYANVHKGLTMVAQWRWRQAFIPQVGSGNTYEESSSGGTVEITSVTDASNGNYNASYNAKGGKAYYATTDEVIKVTATANAGYTFEGWYDASGNLITTNNTYGYTETKEGVNTFYARFSGSVTQTYTAQVGEGDNWQTTTDDTIGTLDRSSYTDVVGTTASCTATAGSNYVFVGWYDSAGNKVTDSMTINDGKTLSYTTTGDATYYARFSPGVRQTFVRKLKSGNSWIDITDDSIGKLNTYSHFDVKGKVVSSTATVGTYYQFEGWYDSDGNEVADSMTFDNGKTLRYTTTGNATYIARFSRIIVEQTYKRQIKNGIGWSNVDDNDIAELSVYSKFCEAGTPASSVAIAKDGFKFEGWYKAGANPHEPDVLISSDVTLSYTATQNATYYARFSREQTQTFDRTLTQANETLSLDTIIPSGIVIDSITSCSSNNADVATVDAAGNVTAVANGNCIVTIEMTTVDGVYKVICNITVNIPSNSGSGGNNNKSHKITKTKLTDEADNLQDSDGSNSGDYLDDNEVANARKSKTGDKSNPVLWIILLLLSLVVMIGFFVKKKSVNEHKSKRKSKRKSKGKRKKNKHNK